MASISPTISPTLSPTANSFFAVSLIDLAILSGIIIICPICIALLCWYQKRKTRRVARAYMAKQEILDRKKKNEEYRRQQTKEYNRKMQQQRLQLTHMSHITACCSQHSGQPLLAPSSAGHSHGHAHGHSHDNSMRHKSSPFPMAKVTKSDDSDSENIPPPPDPPIGGSVPPPPDSTPPQSPDDELVRREKTAPLTISKKKVHFKKRDGGALSVQNKGWTKIASLSTDGMVQNPQESALVIPDADDIMEDAPPSDSPGIKQFDQKSGAPLNGHHGANGTESDSDSSSGEPMVNELAVDQGNLLEVAQKQLSQQSPPSLQTIFNRRVSKKKDGIIVDDDAEDSDEESLMRMHTEYDEVQAGQSTEKDKVEEVGHRKTGTVILDL